MARITIHELEKMTNSKYVCTQKIKLTDPIFGDDEQHILEFDVFDGLAYCPDYKGKEYWIDFPKKKFISMSKDMEETIRKYVKMDDTTPITEKEIMISYNTVRVNA